MKEEELIRLDSKEDILNRMRNWIAEYERRIENIKLNIAGIERIWATLILAQTNDNGVDYIIRTFTEGRSINAEKK